MKRIIFLLVSVMCTITLLHAQDIIVTRDAKRIEAKIVEVSSESVKYLDPSNPEGPTFIMQADEISSVLFQNGQVKVYDEVQEVPKRNKSMMLKEGSANNYLARAGSTYYYNGQEMRGREYEQFLLQNCATAFNAYKSGQNTMIAGWVLLSYGVVGVCAFSALLVTMDRRDYNQYNNAEATYGLVVGLEIAGLTTASASTIASIPCLWVGYTKMHRSVELFNFSCAHKQQAYWSVNASQNGVGLAYNF